MVFFGCSHYHLNVANWPPCPTSTITKTSHTACRNKQGDHWSQRLLFQVHVQRNSWAHDKEDEDWKRESHIFNDAVLWSNGCLFCTCVRRRRWNGFPGTQIFIQSPVYSPNCSPPKQNWRWTSIQSDVIVAQILTWLFRMRSHCRKSDVRYLGPHVNEAQTDSVWFVLFALSWKTDLSHTCL